MIRGNRPRLSQLELAVVTRLVRGLKPYATQLELGINKRQYARIRELILDKLGALNDAQIGVLCERYQLVDVRTQNIIEDRREERLDALRSAP